ncbi:MAG: glycosyltransferase [Patescibacteria group bacterium]|jgi:glycosyltransferase involved in cell wall biosynthesis|nr:glycosyltransferase [Patescibacteria group bacterium]
MKILIVLPALNEEKIIAANVKKLVDFCRQNLGLGWQIVIADNQSTDRTAELASQMVNYYPNVSYLNVSKRGKGAAIRAGWNHSRADIYCFMDADLATDLSALLELIVAFTQGADLVIGNRFHPHSRVKRSWLRKIFSFGYRFVLKLFLGLKIKDAPCGFKAISQDIKDNVLTLVEDDQWFFDSELLIWANKLGYRIKDIPVIWHDPREGLDKTRVKPVSLSLAYFRQVLLIRKHLKKYG